MTQHEIINTATRVIVVCSILHSFLPPWDMLKDFPSAQRYYKLFIYIIGYIAINGRSTIYKSISTSNGSNEQTSTPVPKP